mmetsp:Transcript_99100/g.308841  ORF Transcript_99100/g.308841 Transcript_99100/m.308841 type:complete len:207 (-) Transcript_99100:296-916(-)
MRRVELRLLEAGQVRLLVQPERRHLRPPVHRPELDRAQRLRRHGLLRVTGGRQLGLPHDEEAHLQEAGPGAPHVPDPEQRAELRGLHGHPGHGAPRRVDRRVRRHNVVLQRALFHVRFQRRRLHSGRGLLLRLPAGRPRRPPRGCRRQATGDGDGQRRQPGWPKCQFDRPARTLAAGVHPAVLARGEPQARGGHARRVPRHRDRPW